MAGRPDGQRQFPAGFFGSAFIASDAIGSAGFIGSAAIASGFIGSAAMASDAIGSAGFIASVAIASGFIVGEALVVLVVASLVMMKLLGAEG